MLTDAGSSMSCAACRTASTALPSDTPGAVSKPMVVAGYCATCVICSGACRSVMVATADSGVVLPDAVRSGSWPSIAGVAMPGCASRITRYWLVCVKMVDTMRWPNALYKASSMADAVIDSRAAVSRSMSMVSAAPVAPASDTTLRSASAACMRCDSRVAHCCTVALSAPCRETRNCVGPVSASMVRSCVGCR